MSKYETKDISCPKCSYQVATKIWTSVNVTTEPELRESVLNESLFEWNCPQCGYESQIMYPCLYHDVDLGFMIYLIPDNTKSEIAPKEDIEQKYPHLATIEKRIVVNLNTMKEKILILETGLDDRAVELTKLALAGVVAEKEHKSVLTGYFCVLDQEQNHMGFYFFLEGEDKPVYQGTRVDAYEKCTEIVQDYMSKFEPNYGFIKIDTEWAAEVMSKYKEVNNS